MIVGMKNAAKNIKLNILGVVLGILGIGIPLGIYGITVIPSLNTNPFPYMYLIYIFAVLYVLIGFVVSDIQNARWRRKNAEYDTKLPQDVKDRAWKIRYPLYMAAAIVLTFAITFEILYWILGHYPLPMNF